MMFTFKQFTIRQDACAMKVGTDGVLLGAWAPVDHATHILDIGTGTGLLALMIAQRAPHAMIDAIENDEKALEQARHNTSLTSWSHRVHFFSTSVQNFCTTVHRLYDAIVCNPPYFIDSLKSPNVGRTQARHTDTLTHDDLLLAADRLLTEQGALNVILPTVEADVFIEKAKTYHFSLSKVTHVLPTPTSLAKRRLMHFVRGASSLVETQLVIETNRHVYSDAYKMLTKDFYLKF